ncbi:MAG TPA: hypothetical protein VH878_09850 [Thermodesulfobacteriota bacterium]|jgi:hypothetical protein
MSKRQTTLGKPQNGKPNPRKTQIVVSCVKDGSIEKVEKLQNKKTMKGLYLSAILTEQNRTFLEERCNEGTGNVLVSLLREVWGNYLVGKSITLAKQSGANMQRIDQSTKKVHGAACYQ